jgi:hypothetical protein
MESIRSFWRKLPKPVRSAWITAWVTFVAALLTIVTSLLPELANAISEHNFDPFFDRLHTDSATALSAALAFFAGLVNGIYRWLRPIEQSYREDVPNP